MLKKLPAWYVFLFAAFPVLHLFQYNIANGVQLRDIGLSMVVSQCLAFLVLVLCRVLVRDKEKAIIASYGVLLLFFSYGHVVKVAAVIKGILSIPPNTILLSPLLSIFLMCVLVLFFRNSKRNMAFIALFLKITTGVLIVFNIAQISKYLILTDLSEIDRPLVINKLETPAVLSYYPDIYYIVPDEYGGSKQLLDIYNYDTSSFEDWLIERGFHVLKDRKSKTINTIEAISSILNMKNMNGVKGKHEMLRANKVVKYLKSKGYRIINAGLDLFLTSFTKDVDQTIEGLPFVNQFDLKVIKSTLFGPLLFSHDIQEVIYQKPVLYQITKVADVAKENGPKFIFMHLPIPHAPFVFGSPSKSFGKFSMKWGDKSLYLNQYCFTTDRLKELISSILSGSPKPPIIIIQSDHGVRRHADFKTINQEDQYRIFSAYYLPNQGPKILSDHTSPEDTFRTLFRYYFSEEIVE